MDETVLSIEEVAAIRLNTKPLTAEINAMIRSHENLRVMLATERAWKAKTAQDLVELSRHVHNLIESRNALVGMLTLAIRVTTGEAHPVELLNLLRAAYEMVEPKEDAS